MKASEIIINEYGKFDDKMHITLMLQGVTSIEKRYTNPETGLIEDPNHVFDLVANSLRGFVANRRTPENVKNLAIKCVQEMKYQHKTGGKELK